MEILVPYFKHAGCIIYHNIALNICESIWTGEYVSSNEFREILEQYCSIFNEKKLDTLLSDARKMNMISTEDKSWIINDWYPHIIAAGLKKEALIITQDSFSEISIKKIDKHFETKLVITQYFDNYESAIGWLNSY